MKRVWALLLCVLLVLGGGVGAQAMQLGVFEQGIKVLAGGGLLLEVGSAKWDSGVKVELTIGAFLTEREVLLAYFALLDDEGVWYMPHVAESPGGQERLRGEAKLVLADGDKETVWLRFDGVPQGKPVALVYLGGMGSGPRMCHLNLDEA